MINDAQITAFNSYLNVTTGREKACRLVQYFARFYVFYLLRQGASADTIKRWNNLKSNISIGRKFFRLLKPVEIAQSSIKSLSIVDPVLRVAQFIKFTSNFFYYTTEALNLLDTVQFYKLNNAKRMSEIGLKCWFVSLAASIVASLYQLKQLKARYDDLSSEEANKGQINKVLRKKDVVSYQLVQDLVDMLIPLGGLNWLNLNEGVIGIAGVITSAMAMKTQWQKTNPV